MEKMVKKKKKKKQEGSMSHVRHSFMARKTAPQEIQC